MRSFPVLILLVACDGLGGPGRPPSTDDGLECSFPGWEPASTSSMTITLLEVNNVSVLATHVPAKEYEDYGASACVDPSTGATRWIVESGGEPFVAVEMFATDTGNILMQDYSQYFYVTVLGDITTYGYAVDSEFSNRDFLNGSWVVETLQPLEASVLGDAVNNNGEQLSVNFSAAATAPAR